MVRRKMEAAKQRVARNKNRAAKNDMCKTAELFVGTTGIKDKGVRGKKQLRQARSELCIANTKHSAAAEEEGCMEIST